MPTPSIASPSWPWKNYTSTLRSFPWPVRLRQMSLCELQHLPVSYHSTKLAVGKPDLELLAEGLEHRKHSITVCQWVSEWVSERVGADTHKDPATEITSRHSIGFEPLNSPHVSSNVPALESAPKENTSTRLCWSLAHSQKQPKLHSISTVITDMPSYTPW